MIAALGAELGRRAGWEISVCSTPTAWYAGPRRRRACCGWSSRPAAADGAPTTVRRHCAHELAYVVLTGLAERFEQPARPRPGAQRCATGSRCSRRPSGPGEGLLGALWTKRGDPR